jgi:hypothetical protein
VLRRSIKSERASQGDRKLDAHASSNTIDIDPGVDLVASLGGIGLARQSAQMFRAILCIGHMGRVADGSQHVKKASALGQDFSLSPRRGCAASCRSTVGLHLVAFQPFELKSGIALVASGVGASQ